MRPLAGLATARKICAALVLLFAMTAVLADAQFTQAPPTPTFPPAPGTEQQQRNKTPQEQQVERDAAKQRNVQREQDIKRDTEKLLELATELKQYVDKTNENVISLDVIKKADQIEKLAKSVKEKMKQ
jgi:hypothetical protein